MPSMKKQGDFFKTIRDFAPDRIVHGDDSCLGRKKTRTSIQTSLSDAFSFEV